ncbi:hypothetical protein IFM89_032798 [Coptis chinensis]|uniref:non-specific serine/threonine protein kinase n=1 Tax=Coptis chinensis TaxID=261450 RepID=A0A835HQ70_9MAGN|nr:hypothetical protein IFM89_032798 [Coptis chinensis]
MGKRTSASLSTYFNYKTTYESFAHVAVTKAIDAWKLVLKGRFRLLNEWGSFVEKHQRHNIPEDTWQQLLAFSRCVYEDLEGYDPKDDLLHTACGTPNYVAPEVLNDKGYDGTTEDIWSCGVILFVLMAGYLPLPFDVKSNISDQKGDYLNISLKLQINKADFTCPSWFSSSAKNLIKRILDPNPLTRITIPNILENEWFKKGYIPPDFEQGEDVSLDDVVAVFNDSKEYLVTEKKENPVSMNAFEFISRSQCFDLGSLFEKQEVLSLGYKRFPVM